MGLVAGTYKARVLGVSLEVIGAENYPVMRVSFQPTDFRNGSVFVEGEFQSVDKMYFLKDELATKGPKAGMSQIEILREELKENFGYEGGLDENLSEMEGKTVEIVVEMNKKGYPQVKWVNKEGGNRKAARSLPPEILAKLNASFLGQKPKRGRRGANDAAPDAASFFDRLKAKANA